MKVVVGHSEDVKSSEAIQEVLSQLSSGLDGQLPQAGILFCGIDFDHALILSSIQKAFPGIELIGCTTDGECSSLSGFTEDALTLMVFMSDSVEIRAGVGKGASLLGEKAGLLAVTSAQLGLRDYPHQEKFAIILSDPLSAGVLNFDNDVKEILGRNFPIIGGASAAHSKQKITYQFYKGEVLTDSVVLLLFAGKVIYSCGIKGGHIPIGKKALVTSARNNVLYRIGNRTALDFFHRYIGNGNSLFMNYCLIIYEEGQDDYCIRSVPFWDTQTGSVTLNGQVPEGAMVQLGTADKNAVISSCRDSIRKALAEYSSFRPAAALLFSCAERKVILGTKAIQETQTVRYHLGNIPFCGFYSYGEFGPLEMGEKTLFHGISFVTLLLGSTD